MKPGIQGETDVVREVFGLAARNEEKQASHRSTKLMQKAAPTNSLVS